MPKHIPQRQCLGCRQMKPKPELVRVVRSPEGSVSVDLRGKAPGRGAYVCPSTDCLKKALRSKALSRSLGVEIPPEIYDTLAAQMEEANGTGKG
ncbi:MAG: YlxR family protein [Oscillospiraceae bacterium]|nr:YlxR family protein [Oscillospiraceae bacterium]